MTPLEAARRLAANCPASAYPDEECWRCQFCLQETPWLFEAVPEQFLHALDCPWLMLPQIVTALEGIVSEGLTVAELCDTHAKLCGGAWDGCPMHQHTEGR